MSTFTFDSKSVDAIAKEIERAVEAIGKKHSIDISIGGGKFSGTNVELKLRIAQVTSSGKIMTREAEDFKRHAAHFGLEPTYLHCKFMVNGSEYEIIGLKPRSYKYPILGKNHTGTYKFSTQDVVTGLIQD